MTEGLSAVIEVFSELIESTYSAVWIVEMVPVDGALLTGQNKVVGIFYGIESSLKLLFKDLRPWRS